MKKEVLYAAFPEQYHPEIDALQPGMFSGSYSHLSSSGEFSAIVGGMRLQAPYRIYHDYKQAWINRLDDSTRTILLCLFSRHHDGHVREKCLRELLENPALIEPFVLPYLLKLAEEYVVSCAILVEQNLPEISQYLLKRFLAENPRWTVLMQARCASYRDCYYRHDYPLIADYPGIKAVRFLKTVEKNSGGVEICE